MTEKHVEQQVKQYLEKFKSETVDKYKAIVNALKEIGEQAVPFFFQTFFNGLFLAN
ncbi:MAG: hypothetical protein ACFFDI_26965 [Promethearchaeota archaeon]